MYYIPATIKKIKTYIHTYIIHSLTYIFCDNDIDNIKHFILSCPEVKRFGDFFLVVERS